DKDSKEIKDFFAVAKSYFSKKFGDENIRYAQVHLDETTPHMHLGIVPFNAEKKLSAKTLKSTKQELSVLKQFASYVSDFVQKTLGIDIFEKFKTHQQEKVQERSKDELERGR
ncbi:plasmid recombination protein, partial [Levilactobacillus sp. HBUAS67566]|uniref:plasmid recombination protein n=1 Tax=Levilactobacillus sp. HBUAS67566 TaxID=3109362 RepID=UPI002FF19D24